MTISHQPSRKPSDHDPDPDQSFPEPALPLATPASEHVLPNWSQDPQAAPSDLPALDTASSSVSVSVHPPLLEHADERDYASVTPPLRKKRGPLVAVLAVLAVVVVLGGLLGQHLLDVNSGTSNQTTLSFPSNGPYANAPLSPSQINAIMHLPEHLKDKALASLYVSHMSLNDELGQLIMLEYTGSSYNSNLDYAINTLHVGGVIMYEFQMQTFNQTKGDIAHMQARANIPLLISTDEEGGPYVHRLENIYGLRMSPTQIFESGDVNVATQQGLKVSQQLAALGINEDLAPDVDTNQVNGYDMISRTFGDTSAEVIKYA
ncbi:MAG: glycoside hydrolase family 3 N-terminal domain-containing protein, partial [Ktedonobacteraceae bacterium]